MLSGISARALWPRSRPLSAQSASPPLPPDEQPSVTPDDRDDVQLQDLNNALLVLSEVFPDVRPEVFREMLSTFSDESRLFVVAEAMLQHRAKFVKGRLRVPIRGHAGDVDDEEEATSDLQDTVPTRETFRSNSYKTAVKAAFYQEFRGLTRSTIKAVLAENNYSYLESRQTLADITTRSWRFSVVNLFLRRRVAAESPLVDWSDPELGPVLHRTDSPELNDELESILVTPILQKKVRERVEQDRKLAEELNDAEAEEMMAAFDCECCYIPSSFESITVCSQSGHFVCGRCIRATVKESVFGQGWARSVDVGMSTLRCIAPSSNGECPGHLPQYAVRRALEAEHDTSGLWPKVEDKIAVQNRRAIVDEPLVSCPFCPYAEIEMVAVKTWTAHGLHLIRKSMPYSLICAMACFSLLYCPRDIPFIAWAVSHAFAISLILLWVESPRRCAPTSRPPSRTPSSAPAPSATSPSSRAPAATSWSACAATPCATSAAARSAPRATATSARTSGPTVAPASSAPAATCTRPTTRTRLCGWPRIARSASGGLARARSWAWRSVRSGRSRACCVI
ncbi:hypothetical protein FH972_025972 [Carpinus fangiana]|uniref:RING-type domain-containing protein n=1 Tax=Carpinus fangiana TaxID=176857 RepID=A0A5N6L3J9_9ROSI|nr:hypothetical protein FH972_025972 [Carpinus fangiana]